MGRFKLCEQVFKRVADAYHKHGRALVELGSQPEQPEKMRIKGPLWLILQALRQSARPE